MLKVRKIEKNKDKTHKHSLSGMPETIFWIFVECLRIIGLIRTFVWLIQKNIFLAQVCNCPFRRTKGRGNCNFFFSSEVSFDNLRYISHRFLGTADSI